MAVVADVVGVVGVALAVALAVVAVESNWIKVLFRSHTFILLYCVADCTSGHT